MKFNDEKLYPKNYSDLEVEEGRYVPPIGNNYPDNPHTHIVPIEVIKSVVMDKDYPYLDKSPYFRFRSWLLYVGIYSLVFWLNPIFKGLRIRGRDNITRNKEHFKDGAMTVCNHCLRWDFLGVLQACRWRRMWVAVWREQMQGKDANLMRWVGGIPIPEGIGGKKQFFAAFDELHEKKKWIHFFPAGCRWDYYTPIRPLRKGAFMMAIKYNLPIIPMAYSYREPKGIYKLITKKPLPTLNVGEPLFIDKSLPRNEALEDIRKRTFEAMVKLAGIKKNPWNYNDTEQ